MSHPLALITGATRGIGLQFAHLFARDGYAVAIVARSRDDLDALANTLGADYGVPVITMARDLSEPGAALSIEAALNTSEYPLSVVVNNAGQELWGEIAALGVQEQTDLIQVNVVALFRLTRLLLPILQARQGEGVINVASIAGLLPGRGMAVYAASKAFVVAFSEALYEELKGSGLKVTCLLADASDIESQKMPYSKNTAQLGYEGFKSGRPRVVSSFRNQIGLGLMNLFPRQWVRQLMVRLFTKKR